MKKAAVIQTAKDLGDRLTSKESINFLPQPHAIKTDKIISYNPEIKFQEILGFGGAFTEAGAYVLSNIDQEKRAGIIESYFHPQKGIAYSLCRTHINSCDFSLGNYSYDDVEGDKELLHFNIEHDNKYLIPFIKQALGLAGAKFLLLASPWSPPFWMKTNKKMNNGGKLKPEYREAWALFLAKYIKAYEEEGIPIWGITVQNEPNAVQTWDSCIYTGEEERDFIRDYLGPRLAKDGLKDKKIIIWDHNRDLIFDRTKIVLSDKKAAQYIWGVGFHWYADDEFENLSRTHQAFPDKPLLLTEASLMGGVKLGAWDRGEIYAYNIIEDLNNWASGWIDWNMVLNIKGGPNHAGNFCDAPVLVDEDKGQINYQSSYYYMGHFSKYIRPGARRIQSQSTHHELETVAFKNPDQSIVIVVLNRTGQEFQFTISDDGEAAEASSPAHSIMTFIIS
jgi:glucosylceramidase